MPSAVRAVVTYAPFIATGGGGSASPDPSRAVTCRAATGSPSG